MQVKNTERIAPVKTKTVFISPNPVRESEMLDKAGNVIDPRTKQILKTAEENK